MKFFLFIIAFFLVITAYSQDEPATRTLNLHGLFNELVTALPGVETGDLKNSIIKNPDLWNIVWDHFINNDSTKTKVVFLRDLNLAFKTFQDADSAITAIGFAYDWNLRFTKEYENGFKRGGFAFGLNANGNVAFTKRLNPYDFLKTDLRFGTYWFMGGITRVNDSIVFTRRNELRRQLVNMNTTEEILNSDVYKEYVQSMHLGNQYMLDLQINAGLEGNQDFTKKQYAYGVLLSLGAKAWNDNNALALLNVFDYPFVITRWLTKTDASFSPYGATIPVLIFGLDYVKPQQDVARKQLAGNLNGYARFRFETGFRTLMASVKDQDIFFNAGYRYFKEFNAPAAVKMANLDRFSYFVASITSSQGFFISYSNGNLPFDAKEDAVYELGFNYKF